MHILSVSPGEFVPFFIFAIPIVAIVGGITAGIVQMLSRQRMIELAQRERIAAIERGVDPSKLPPLPTAGLEDIAGVPMTAQDHARRRVQGLLIGGLVTLAVGVSLAIFLRLVTQDQGVWAVGLIPASVGIALLLSAALIRPRNDNGSTPPRVG
jgi:hypothetical protein